ncbi:glycoside hydrolase family 3 C-terminal domain-containing protein [Shewanella sp. 1CM18E]|uniref:glycoside hydrolase family 3 protein n=1 Tax=Shewanella sp. 1CM18E TaxID=2929169 RepID=UPI00207D5A15|nr:glycoside hydrolase family 3 N-terminal domain-containing protein [Shewanella sp. 1CM18E]MCK8043275.1 glycoside hydrolase family 3 C-terminal domain-containing protein [Shewanella sp. 1CM18E]
MLTAAFASQSCSFLRKIKLLSCTFLLTCGCSSGHSEPSQASENTSQKISIWPELNFEVKPDKQLEQKVADLVSEMTLKQKVAQVIQPEIGDFTLEDMREYGFGSYLNGGGSFPNGNKHLSINDWVTFAEAMYQASIDDELDGSSIPTMWGTDAVHGHNNVIGATLFPHNIGLGAANNPKLIEQIATVTAKEVKVTGIDWVFAPTVAVARDDRWGRTYESYSEDPNIVKSYASAIVKGLQGDVNEDFLSELRVIATTKHFLGDGGTLSGIDQGDNLDSEQALFDIHAQGYISGLSAGAQVVMASFNSWQGTKIHGSEYLLTQVLKERLGFDGIVVGDWNGHGQVAGCSNESCPEAFNAGLDIYMAPGKSWKPLFDNLVAQVKSGEIAMQRLDDAVSRVLRVKFRTGLFTKPSPANRQYANQAELIGANEHRALASQAVRESLVLLKNNNNLLPLSGKQIVMVAGDGANNLAKQAGGWSVSWQGSSNQNSDFPDATSIFSGIKAQVNQAGGKAFLSVNGRYAIKPDVAIVVFGEEPYAEGYGDLDNLEYQRGDKRDLALLRRLKAAGIPVISIFISGRPLWINAELNASDAFVAAWLPGSEGDGIAQVLFRDSADNVQFDFSGKLSFSWPNHPEQTRLNINDTDYKPLFSYGYGLSYQGNYHNNYQNNVNLPELEEQYVAATKALTPLTIYDGKAYKPWRLNIKPQSSNHDEYGSSTKARRVKGVMLSLATYQTQADALTIDFEGNAKAKMSFKSAFPRDLRSYSEQESMLSFAVKLDKLPSAQVQLIMQSDKYGKKAVDITQALKSLYRKGWQTMNVDFNCFIKQGMHFADISSPFALKTKGQLVMDIAKIQLKEASWGKKGDDDNNENAATVEQSVNIQCTNVL